MSISLHIISPEGPVAEATASSVSLPGALCPFVVLKDHAPLISSLVAGDVVWVDEEGEHREGIGGGFVEVRDNVVTVCVEK